VNSPIGLNAQLCCSRFDLPLSRLIFVDRNFVQRRVSLQSAVHCSAVSVIRDMLCVKSRQMMISGFKSRDIDFMLIVEVCVYFIVLLCIFYTHYCTRFVINRQISYQCRLNANVNATLIGAHRWTDAYFVVMVTTSVSHFTQ